MVTILTGLKDTKLIWGNECEQAFPAHKKSLVQPPVLAYPMRHGPFVLSADASDTGMGTVLEQEQDEEGWVGKMGHYICLESLNTSQQRYHTTNQEFLAVVTDMELFKYFLTGRHLTVVTNHTSLTWLRNCKEPDGVDHSAPAI